MSIGLLFQGKLEVLEVGVKPSRWGAPPVAFGDNPSRKWRRPSSARQSVLGLGLSAWTCPFVSEVSALGPGRCSRVLGVSSPRWVSAQNTGSSRD